MADDWTGTIDGKDYDRVPGGEIASRIWSMMRPVVDSKSFRSSVDRPEYYYIPPPGRRVAFLASISCRPLSGDAALRVGSHKQYAHGVQWGE